MRSWRSLLFLSCFLSLSFFSFILAEAETRAEVCRRQALNFSRNRQWEQAINKYQEALRLEPNHPDTHYNLALVLKYKGDAKAAGEAFQAALRLNPFWADAHYGLGARTTI